MEVKQLQAFIRVAELGSFSHAATSLGVSQSVLSRQVGQLEIELGRHLLHRHGRGVTTTPAGKRFLAHSLGIVRQLEAAREDLQADESSPLGHVIVGLPPRIASTLAARVVMGFRAAFPRATLRVVEGPTAAINDWLLLGRVDLGLLNNPPPSPQLHCEPVYAEHFHLVGARRGPVGLPRTVPLRALHRYPLIIPGRPHSVRNLLDEVCQARGIPLDIVLEVDPIEAILELVEAGLGYCILTRNSITDEARFQCARICGPAVTNQLVVGTPGQRTISTLVLRTAELLRREARAMAPPDSHS